MALGERAESPELQAFVDRIEDHPFYREEFVSRVLTACVDRWPGYNVFIFDNDHGNFQYSVEDPNALEATAVHDLTFWRYEHFKVVVFKSAGTLEKTGGDGGKTNWQMAGWFSSENDGNKAVFSAPP